eukprot:210197-Hanusia_phi.AAC.1
MRSRDVIKWKHEAPTLKVQEAQEGAVILCMPLDRQALAEIRTRMKDRSSSDPEPPGREIQASC